MAVKQWQSNRDQGEQPTRTELLEHHSNRKTPQSNRVVHGSQTEIRGYSPLKQSCYNITVKQNKMSELRQRECKYHSQTEQNITANRISHSTPEQSITEPQSKLPMLDHSQTVAKHHSFIMEQHTTQSKRPLDTISKIQLKDCVKYSLRINEYLNKFKTAVMFAVRSMHIIYTYWHRICSVALNQNHPGVYLCPAVSDTQP